MNIADELQKLLADHNGDVHAYVEDARKRALESGRLIVPSKQRTKLCTNVADKPLPDGGTVAATR